MTIRFDVGDALIVGDVQNDFLPGGSLAVSGGDEVIAPLNRCMEQFHAQGLPIVAVRDWHPEHHCSFQERGGPWPPHCVQNTHGAEYAPGLRLPEGTHAVIKGTLPDKDAYSAFDGTGLHAWLREQDVERLFVGGLCTDYCVRQTTPDARKLGYEVYVLVDAVRAVSADTEDAAFDEMRLAGAHPVSSDELLPA
ncbi:MAG TPA: nicotinamidase [Mariprofundaceae bacterium]|nr:nicotinamidase [Mariprofundaceae bacterium]